MFAGAEGSVEEAEGCSRCCWPGRVIVDVLPLPQGALGRGFSTLTLPLPLAMKSWKMCKAIIAHIPTGYAAVGEVAKPPPGKVPIICWS